MEQSKIDLFISTNNEKFPPEAMMTIREKLAKMDDQKFGLLQTIPFKNPTTMMIIAWLVGSLGVDRFMLGDTGLGVVKLLTCGGMGIWALIDIFTAAGRTRAWNLQKFNEIAG